MFLEISQNSQEGMCARVSFLIKFQPLGLLIVLLNSIIALLMLYYIDKNWCYFIKKYLEQISKFAFQEVAHPVGWPSRHILEILLACRQTLVGQNCGASVRLHHWGNLLMTASDSSKRVLSNIKILRKTPVPKPVFLMNLNFN